MKSFNNLYKKIYASSNLLFAAKKAQQGKRFQVNVAPFNFHLEKELAALRNELVNFTYQPGTYREFFIFDPKKRKISAAPYRDRVVHHALCNIIEPLIDRKFIYDSYANRIGKGTHRAIVRFQQFARKYPYVLKCDIKQYFPNIDHLILKQIIRRHIKCQGTLWLCDRIIDNSNPQEADLNWFTGDDLFSVSQRRKGLPIGNLTSQFWANLYLDSFDHFVKEDLLCKGYIRYVDDFVLFGKDKALLWKQKEQLAAYLAKYRLRLHQHKTVIYPVKFGVPFLGFRMFPHHKLLKKQNVRYCRKRIKKKIKKYLNGEISIEKLEASLQSWQAHASFGNTFRLKQKILQEVRDVGFELVETDRGSWRLLEQQ